ncbi:MAG TPA: FKBP-type peptidyl-prolyl cis-trans isomerase [candidate division Zixibacteria bacterium]|nr:FKBP-type peptidyl-prolyl cis-trans isomerase [candidate division Zixibacteria bacterium]
MKRLIFLTIITLGAFAAAFAWSGTESGEITVRADSAAKAADSAGQQGADKGKKAGKAHGESNDAQPADTVTTESGLKYVVHHEGTGPVAKRGQLVSVHYRGRLVDGKEFDNSYKRKQPLQFPLGRGRVIKGWDEGILGMRVGEARTLIIPSDLAYGERGMPPAGIGPNATLIFDLELVAIK